MYSYTPPLKSAQTLLEDAISGRFRGRESFCKMLEAISVLQSVENNPYQALKTTKEEFEEHLHGMYRRAARENYEDSTDERFLGSNRPVLEALSDLHLVPAYMALGGLDPQLESSWLECGINHDDYINTYNARRIDEAARIWELIENRPRQAASNIIAHENIMTLFKEAGLDATDENTYARIKTTKHDFNTYHQTQKNLRDHPYAKLSFA